MSFRELCNKPESDSSDDNCEVLGEFIDPTLFNINSDDDTESSHRWTRTHLTFLDDFVCLCWGLTSQSTIFQSCRDGANASWVINQYFRGVKCLVQGHNTAAVGFEPPTSRSGVRHSTTEPPRSPIPRWWGIVCRWPDRPRVAAGNG